MKYEIQTNVLQEIARQFTHQMPVRRQIALFIIFGLLLLLVILGCTIGGGPMVAVALIGVLVVGIGAILKPRLALLLIFIGAGLPALLLPLPGHNMRLVEAALWLCLLVVIVWRPHVRFHLSHLLALLFLAIAVVSFVHVPEISTGVDSYTADKQLYEVILIVLAFFCGTFLAMHVKDASSFLVTVLLGNIPLCLIGLGQALDIHFPSFLALSTPAQSGGRLPGPFVGPVDFGMYLVNLFAIALACWLLSKRRRDQFIGAGMTIAIALEIIGSGTRNAAIGAIVIAIVAFTLTRHFKMLLSVSILAGVMVATFFNKILQLFAHDSTSVSNRLFLSQEATKLIASHPWIGIGLWQFPKYYALLIVSQGARLDPHGGVSVHEQYLEWALDSGIFWLIVGVLLLLSITYACWRAYCFAQRKQQVLLLAALLAMLANIIMGFFDVPISETEGAAFLFLLAGLALSYAMHTGEASAEQRRTVHTSRLWPLVPYTWNGMAIKSRVPSGPLQVESSPSSSATSSSSDLAPNIQKTSRSVIIQIVSWAIPLPLVLVVTALLTRYLGPIQYGEYSFTFAFFAIFALLSGTGMDQLFIRQLVRQTRAEWANTFSYAVGTRLLSTALSAAVAILLILVLPINAELKDLLLLGSVWLFFSFSVNTLRTVYSYGFAAEQRVGILSLLTTINRLVTSGLVIVIVLLRIPLLWAYAIIVYSDLPFFLILVLVARRRFGVRVRFSLAYTRKHLLDSLPLTGYDALALLAGQADMFLLILLSGPLSVGFYALAIRLTNPLLSIVFAYVGGLYPLLCAKFEEGRKQFSKVYQESARILALVTIPLAILVSLRASSIIALLGGQKFAPAAIALQLLMWSTAAGFFQQLAMQTSTAANLERRGPYLSAISVSINLLLNLALIPHWQFIGAAIASLASELISLCLFNLILRRQVHLLPVIGMLLRVFLGNLPMVLFLIWQQQAPLLLTIPPALVLSVVGCLVTRVLSVKDVRLMRDILDARRNKEALKDISERTTLILPRIQDAAN